MTTSIVPGKQYRAMLNGREVVVEAVCCADDGQTWVCTGIEHARGEGQILLRASELRPRNVQRRRWKRTSKPRKTLVEIRKRIMHVVLGDESKGGACLVFDSDPQLDLRERFTVWHRQAPNTAEVRSILERHGRYRIGIRWIRDEKPYGEQAIQA